MPQILKLKSHPVPYPHYLRVVNKEQVVPAPQ